MIQDRAETPPAGWQGLRDPLADELYRSALLAADRILRRDDLELEELGRLVETLEAIHELLARRDR